MHMSFETNTNAIGMRGGVWASNFRLKSSRSYHNLHFKIKY